MSREILALAMLMVLAGTIAAVMVFTTRYTKYRRAIMRGRRHLKPVWRPFWMN